MTTIRKTRLLAAVFVASGLGACGGGDSGSDPNVGSDPTLNPTPAPAPAPPPVATPSPSPFPSPGGTEVSACLNRQLWEQANTVQLGQVSTGADSGDTALVMQTTPGVLHDDGDPQTPNETVTEIKSRFTHVQAAGTINSETVFLQKLSGNQIYLYRTSSSSGQVRTFNPPLLDARYTLAPGEMAVNASPIQIGQTINSRLRYEFRVRYDGREAIVVPAGTFETCKFTIFSRAIDGVVSGSTSTGTEWVAIDTGLIVRAEGAAYSVQLRPGIGKTELVSGSINAAPVN